MAMFQTEMVEAKNGRVEIHGFSVDAVKGMLEFIYTGKTDIPLESAEEYKIIGDMYQLEGLKSDADKVLAANMKYESSFIHMAR